MAWASISGRAKTSPSNPQAHAICDRCGFRYNHVNLKWQFDWAGASLINKRILVCDSCYDKPQEQLRAIIVPADPVPIINPRVEAYIDDETNYLTTSGPLVVDQRTNIPIPSTTIIVDENGNAQTMQPIGAPVGLDGNSQVPLIGNVEYGRKLPTLSISSNGTTVVTVTCSSVHGLSTDDQVSVEGITNSKAAGAYSIKVTTATAFTYETNSAITAGSLITGSTRIITILVGLPYGYTQIPQVGP